MTRSPLLVPPSLSWALSELIVRYRQAGRWIGPGDRRQDRDAIRGTATGGRDAFVDDVVAVAEAERVGVVAKAAVEGVDPGIDG